jgi:D-alanine-D-alanine ligase
MQAFGKVAVLMGGWSAEREVSLNSGQAVLQALKNQGVDAHGIDVDRNIMNELQGFDRVFNILHGRGGEDGVIQGMLDVMQMPYTGSDVLGSALTMDKLLTKQLWQGIDLPTPAYKVLETEQDCQRAVEDLGLPLMIKPVLEGSSLGMSKVQNEKDMISSWQKAKKCGGTIMAEQFIEGSEYTAAILNGQVLPMIRLETPREFYDYQAKYADDTETKYHCPCGLEKKEESGFAEMMLQAFNAVHASSWGRVDFMLDNRKQPWLIEVNTVPGMTNHSLVPMAAEQAGISFDHLVVEILKETLN